MAVVLDTEKLKGFQELTLAHIARLEKDHGFATPEILFGMAELTGRLIASNTDTWIAARDLLVELAKHMERAAITGAKVKYDSNRIVTPNH